MDIFSLLNNLICSFQHLKEFHLSDCKLNFLDDDIGNSPMKLFNSIKSKIIFFFQFYGLNFFKVNFYRFKVDRSGHFVQQYWL
jgi:hypothetical protein